MHAETYGKTGARRIVPGQYLACDPHGRAAMVAAVEKQKLVYILNRDSTATLTISSPLEAHKSFTICFDIVGVDVGYDNPIFACLELDYEEADRDPSGAAVDVAEKQLTYYELDLGLNNVVRKWSEAVPARSNKLIAVPGGTDGPSGVLVCAEGIITWRNQNYKPVTVPIPRRRHPLQNRERDPIIVQSTLVKTRVRLFLRAFIETEQLNLPSCDLVRYVATLLLSAAERGR